MTLERIGLGLPTLARVDYGKDKDEAYNHFVVIVGKDGAGRLIMNDPGTRDGDGATDPSGDDVIGATSRQGGYTIVKLDLFDVSGDTATVGTGASGVTSRSSRIHSSTKPTVTRRRRRPSPPRPAGGARSPTGAWAGRGPWRG